MVVCITRMQIRKLRQPASGYRFLVMTMALFGWLAPIEPAWSEDSYLSEAEAARNRNTQVWDYLASALAGDPRAQHLWALGFLGKDSRAQEQARALFWLRNAADLGLPHSHYMIGRMYRDGFGVLKDRKLSEHHYEQAASGWLKLAAEQNQPVAQTILGLLYLRGSGVLQDTDGAVYWWLKAAKQGYGNAYANLSILYQDGEFVPKNLQRAKRYMAKAKGPHLDYSPNKYVFPVGIFAVGIDAERVRWFRYAAEKRNPYAEFQLGRLYTGYSSSITEFSVSADHELAVKWYARAAEKGLAVAQLALALEYKLPSTSAESNCKKGVYWFRRAARQGLPTAQIVLGGYYTWPKCHKKNYVLAAKWLMRKSVV